MTRHPVNSQMTAYFSRRRRRRRSSTIVPRITTPKMMVDTTSRTVADLTPWNPAYGLARTRPGAGSGLIPQKRFGGLGYSQPEPLDQPCAPKTRWLALPGPCEVSAPGVSYRWRCGRHLPVLQRTFCRSVYVDQTVARASADGHAPTGHRAGDRHLTRSGAGRKAANSGSPGAPREISCRVMNTKGCTHLT